jgi:chromosomal replication initiation ATPase DnaA
MITPRDRMLDIVDQVAFWHGVTSADIFGKSKMRGFVIPRRDAICAIVRNWPHRSYPEVGRFFGLDHSTIQHHLEVAGVKVPRQIAQHWQAGRFAIWQEQRPGHGMQAAE